jgi:hypothetical protein
VKKAVALTAFFAINTNTRSRHSAVSPPPAKVTNSFRRLDDRSFEASSKRDGKVTSTIRVVISPDGKTMTQTGTGTDAQGRAINNILVYDKQ